MQLRLSIFILIVFGFVHQGISQSIYKSVIGNAGSTSTVGTTTLQWTIGEVAVLRLEAEDRLLTQGFHQGERSGGENCPPPVITNTQALTCDFNSVGIDTIFAFTTAGCDSIIIVERTFGFPPSPILNITMDSTFCAGDTVVLRTDTYNTRLQWIKDDEEVEGATGQSLAATESGTYTVAYTNEDGCTVLSRLIDLIVKAPPAMPVFDNTNNLLALVEEGNFESVTFQWYFEGEPIAGATQPQYCATSSGTYTLEVQKEGCRNQFSLTIEIDESTSNCTVATDELLSPNRFEIFPNPASSSLTVIFELRQQTTATIDLINSSGQLVRSWKDEFQVGQQDVLFAELQDLASGVYLVKLSTAAGVIHSLVNIVH